MIITVGLPLGFYMVFATLNPIDHLKQASSEIGEEFIRGMQRGVNETLLNDLVNKLTGTIVKGLNINQKTSVNIPFIGQGPIPSTLRH